MAYTIDIYDTKGKKKSSIDLSKDLYNDDVVSEDLITDYVAYQRANARIAIANTKTR
jgi:ribosomal protein L4